MASLFFSYSHHDEQLRDELEVHLSPLKRQGIIEAWHDRRIVAGDDFAGAISEHLQVADIVLLLVSPYFLNSNYCYDVEMRRALERHVKGECRVIPVILDPCDWHSAPFGNLLAMPTDGKPVTKFPNRHDAFLEVAKAVRQAAEKLGVPAAASVQRPPAPATSVVRAESRSSNLAIKKTFSDHDRDSFLESSYEYIANFFEGSLNELAKRNPEISVRFRRVDSNSFTAHVYRSGASIGECSVRFGSKYGSAITYSHSADSTNSFNESLSVANNGHMLGLSPMGMAIKRVEESGMLSPQGAAEQFWALLIQPLQR